MAAYVRLASVTAKIELITSGAAIVNDVVKKERQRLVDLGKSGPDAIPHIRVLERFALYPMRPKMRPVLVHVSEYKSVPATSMVSLGNEAQFPIPLYGEYINDMVLHVRFRASEITVSEGGSETFRYVSNLASNLITSMDFLVNSNSLTGKKTGFDYYVYENTMCPIAHRAGLARLLGETTVSRAFDVVNSTTAVPVAEDVIDGPALQAMSVAHGAFELFIPCLFFFCEALENALPVATFAGSSRTLSVNFASVQNITALSTAGTPFLSEPAIDGVSLYVNNIFLPSWLTEIIANKMIFSLARVTTVYNHDIVSQNQNIEINICYPTEAIWVATLPRVCHKTKNNYNFTIPADVTRAHIPGTSPIKRISVSANDSRFYDATPSLLANSYFPFSVGKKTLSSPASRGLYLIPFATLLGVHQPYGSYSGTRDQRLVFRLESDYYGTPQPAYDEATGAEATEPAIATGTVFFQLTYHNFMVVMENTCMLKYTT